MILEIYSVHDKKAKLFARPFFLQNVPVAMRALQSNVLKDTEMSQHVDDYAVYRLGNYDESNGLLHAYDQPELISEMRAIKDAAIAAQKDPRQENLPLNPADKPL